jgi:Metallo-peptidase family M12B Reprolysin-like
MKRGLLCRVGGSGYVCNAIAMGFVLAAFAAPVSAQSGRELWQAGSRSAARVEEGDTALALRPARSQARTLDRSGMAALLAHAPREFTSAARQRPLVIELPDPKGGFQRFLLVESPVMEKALAVRHPEIKTYAGRGIDDPTATLRADLTPLGFHASVRSTQGAWYIDPARHLDQSLYLSYFRRDLKDNPHGAFTDVVARDNDGAEISTDHAYYHAADEVVLHGAGFAPNAQVTLTISDPNDSFGERTLEAATDALGAFEAGFVADPGAALGPHQVAADDGNGPALTLYDVVSDDDASHDPPTGDVLRTYRLALITDPGYATFFGGSGNVTAAKVTLINRVTQVYEGDMSIRLTLVGNNDLLNLDTWDLATSPNGPCGTAACFTQSQVTGCSSTTRARFVIGQVIGASNYDIGHLALGEPGGGVANLGVVGRSNKAGGCTGIPTPVGDFYAVDYVAHEMGHQFSGNHPFNGNQLNCSGGNRNASTSVEPGSGSSIMAYAGICLTDDLQPHSDPYFSQRSLQEIVTYVTSSQAAINEVQTASLRHLGGGNEVQVATFGPGFSAASTIQPLTLTINAAPSATSRGGAEEDGNTATIATSASHTLKVGDVVTIAGVGVAGYNGTWTVTAVPSSRAFQYTNPTAGLANSGGGTVTLAAPGATESGTTATISTSAAHGRSVGEVVTISGVSPSGYNGTFTITAVPTTRTFEYTALSSGLANGGGGTATVFGSFQVRIDGNDSVVLGGSGLPYTTANLQTAINAIAGFAGTVTVSGAASTGFTLTYGGASAGLDVSTAEIVNLSCGGCFASVEETSHGGAYDSFTVNHNGADSATISNDPGGANNYTNAGIKTAIEGISGWPAGGTVTIANFGGGGSASVNGFQVTFGGTLAASNVPVLLAITNPSAGLSGFFGETDKGGAVDNGGGIVTATGNAVPAVSAPVSVTIPLRTPFYLTGSATDGDNDPLVFSWEQNDRGGSAGTSLLNDVKTNGPLFAMFPMSGQISETDTLEYGSPGENQLTMNPTRIFPDLQQVLDNNTNADTGGCPVDADIAPPVPIETRECYAEFLPTLDYVGFAGTNATPLALHFRFTARDGKGGVNAADTTVLLDKNAGPFRVTAPDSAAPLQGSATQLVTWDVANTDLAPTSVSDVTIRLSVDGGHTYPYTLAASTPNDGSEAVTLPNVATSEARVMVDATSNGFFDVSNVDFEIVPDNTPPTVTVTAPNGGETAFSGVPYLVSWTASDDVALASFDVFVSYDGGSSFDPTPVCDDVPGTSTSCLATFTVGATNTNVRVRVVAVDAGGNSASDASNASFQVLTSNPYITVTAPDTAGVSWQAGDTKPIRFIHNLGTGAAVRIELNRDYPGGSWEAIAASTPTTARGNSVYKWTVTAPLTMGATARVRITAVDLPSVGDTNNVSFAITSRVKVTAPNNAAKWKVGATKAIKFNHNYATPHAFSIGIDRDGDGACEQVLVPTFNATGPTGTYNWLVSVPAGTTNRICVASKSDPFGTDISDVAFTINP